MWPNKVLRSKNGHTSELLVHTDTGLVHTPTHTTARYLNTFPSVLSCSLPPCRLFSAEMSAPRGAARELNSTEPLVIYNVTILSSNDCCCCPYRQLEPSTPGHMTHFSFVQR